MTDCAGVGEAAAACTAATWVAVPAGSTIGGGGENCCGTTALADVAAYRYIAAALLTHMAMYSASVSAIAGRLIPKKLVASRTASRARLAATTAGCTTVKWVSSNADTTASIDAATRSHCAAVAVSQSR
ncbi:hypothetical protein BN971_03259 [Mycobacterium bohemicum DSM 44277]|uniref:Uncharacterized protein n=1 Tax=Mycobacterium bohemicum DSM 44277 TaxID=1236609 RepID=A0A0U0WAC8_MYCBE|nr:hypothetical protein BN971_03259 [Mycobacterium bohemicum DSM 44277]